MLVSAAVLTCVSTLYCAIRNPNLYQTFSDGALQVSVEFVANVAIAVGLWLLLTLLRQVDLKRPRRAAAVAVVLFAIAAVTGRSVYIYVFRSSVLLGLMPPRVWMASLAAVVTVVLVITWVLLRQRVPRWFVLVQVLAGIVGISTILMAQRRFEYHYGNLHVTAAVLSLAIVAVAGSWVVLRLGARARSILPAAALGVVASTIVIAGLEPSLRARRLLFELGALSKYAVPAGVWPLVDRDADGVPSQLWGQDPDDGNALVTALNGESRSAEVPRHDNLQAYDKPSRNLVWVLMDTTRKDSFDAAIKANSLASSVFSTFTSYERFASCSSRTHQVLNQVLGERACAPNSGGVLRLMKSLGYHDHYLGYFVRYPFTKTEALPTDDAVLATARRVLAQKYDAPLFLFLHLKAAHEPLPGPGNFLERYNREVTATVQRVAQFVSGIDPQDTSVIVSADHGSSLGERGHWGHGRSLYEEVLRVPFFVRTSFAAAGPRFDVAGCADVPEIVSHAVGAQRRSPEVAGVQFASMDFPKSSNGFLRNAGKRSLRFGTQKVVWEPYVGIWELYDLARDPQELNDLSWQQPEALAVAKKRLHAAIAACQGDTPDTQIPGQELAGLEVASRSAGR